MVLRSLRVPLRSDRVVSVYGAVASPAELTLIMEFVERGSLRSVSIINRRGRVLSVEQTVFLEESR